MSTWLPRSWLFGHPEKSCPKISPDGRHLSYLAPQHNHLALIIQKLENLEKSDLKSEAFDLKQHMIQEYEWAYTHNHIIYSNDAEGDENAVLYCLAINSNTAPIRLTPKNTQAKLIKLSARYPDKIAILINNRHSGIFDVCVVNIHTAEMTQVYQNKEYIDIYVDEDFKPKIGIKPNSDGTCRVDYLNQIDYQPSVVTKLSQLDFMGIYRYKENRMGLNAEGNAVFFAQSTETDKAQLIRISLIDFSKKTLALDSSCDYQDVIFDPISREPIAAAFNYQIKKWQIINPDKTKLIRPLIDYRPNHELSVLSQSQDNAIWLVAYVSDRHTPEYCLYHTKTKSIRHLFFSDLPLNQFKELVAQQCVEVPTKDGLNIPCYLSLPLPSQLVQDKKIALILWIHGGPNARDFWGFNPVHQWLSNRGYAVLSINFRGSTGFGRAFLEAGNGEWGGKIAEDIKTCAEWVAKKYTIINPDKIAIMGRSFGGYSALMGLAKYPDFYACAVDWVGPTNLNDLLEQSPPYWKIVHDLLIKMLGDATVRLAHSPDQYIHQFKKPLLKAHGAHDIQVNHRGPDAFIAQLEKHLPDLFYGTFPNEGHRFRHANNKIAFYTMVEAFAAQYLGGGLEPIQDEIEKSTFIKYIKKAV